MELNEYQRLASRTAKHGSRVENWALGLCGEAGEVADLIKKMIFHGHSYDTSKIRDELGDVLWYVSVLAREFDISLDEVAKYNLSKLESRYPGGFSEHLSRNREG